MLRVALAFSGNFSRLKQIDTLDALRLGSLIQEAGRSSQLRFVAIGTKRTIPTAAAFVRYWTKADKARPLELA
jgi:hypothetical protein